ncbi:preprotein translocase subunit SecG [Pseudoroseomonas cervicalis]|uniref:preprotein translocase subunit SecG n=1 Tax=Teichococcus cervicalis TaxID=204525 RepID=UPI0035ED0687
MMTVLLVLHLFVTLALIGVVLLQRSEGGGLGIGSSQGMGSFMTGRGTANLLTRTTAILATLFMGLALAMAMLGRGEAQRGSILDAPPPPASSARRCPAAAAPRPGPARGAAAGLGAHQLTVPESGAGRKPRRPSLLWGVASRDPRFRQSAALPCHVLFVAGGAR